MRLFILVSILFLLSCSQQKSRIPETYVAGYKTIRTTDSARIFKPNTNTTDYLHFRPLDIDLWYPGVGSPKDTALLFRDVLGVLESRANYYTASEAGNGLTLQLAQYFCEFFKCSDSSKVLKVRTQTIKGALPAEGKYPLVVYLASYDGMSYENYLMFEELAQKGYVVACVSSIGRYPGNMSMKMADLMEQVNDALVAFRSLQANTTIDFSKVAIMGYSWGGLAGTILANKIPNTACLISLDGSEFHHYGSDKEADRDFDSTRYSDLFRNMKISVPYLRLESSHPPSNEKEDSVYDFTEKLGSDKQLYKIDSSLHQDFGCLPIVVRKSGNCQMPGHYNTMSRLVVSYLDEQLKVGKGFSKAVGEELSKTIRRK